MPFVSSRNLAVARTREYFREAKQLPHIELLKGLSSHEVNFNMDYYPAATLRHGPVSQLVISSIWRNRMEDRA